MPVGRGVGDAGLPRHLGHGEALRPPLRDQRQGGGDQRLGQIAVMVAALAARAALLAVVIARAIHAPPYRRGRGRDQWRAGRAR